MAVTITATQVENATAGSKNFPSENFAFEVVRLTGSGVANNDTGTYRTKTKAKLVSSSIPLVVGLPNGINPSIADDLITFTNATGGSITTLALTVLVAVEK